jgi:hypothetical protein
MGKKKAFIDKKRSTTYTLVFRSTDEHEDPENAEPDRVLVPAGELGGAGREDQPPSDPRALYAHFFGDDDEEEVNTDVCRRIAWACCACWEKRQSCVAAAAAATAAACYCMTSAAAPNISMVYASVCTMYLACAMHCHTHAAACWVPARRTHQAGAHKACMQAGHA